jgi:tetratricopeptide (TPR) repeat protein
MLPVSLWLYDVFFIRPKQHLISRREAGVFLALVVIVLAIALSWTGVSGLLSGYQHRPFTPIERLLTQQRVLWYYLGLIAYPTDSRLMLLHDFQESTGLLAPYTTLPALLGLAIMAAAGFALRQRLPAVGFALLFFLVNHAVEGSFLSLEMVFEHRNYLPSTFLFLAVAWAFDRSLQWFWTSRTVRCAMTIAVIVSLAAQGHTAFLRNDRFQDRVRFWQDNVEKAPGISRPHHNLGWALLSSGKPEEGLEELHQALVTRANTSRLEHYITYQALGQHALDGGQEEMAVGYFKASVALVPNNPAVLVNLALLMLYRDDMDKALLYINRSLAHSVDNGKAINTLGLFLLKSGDVKGARQCALTALKLSPEDATPHFLMGEAYRQQQDFVNAERSYQMFARHYPANIPVRLVLVELYAVSLQTDKRNAAVIDLLAALDAGGVSFDNALSNYQRRYNHLDVNRVDRIRCAVVAGLRDQAGEIELRRRLPPF